MPAAFAPRPDQLLIVPAWHIFGSEALSMLAPSVAELAPAPYVAVNPADAARFGLAEGGNATLRFAGQTLALTVRIVPALPVGVATLGAGLRGQPYVEMPAWGRVALRQEAAP